MKHVSLLVSGLCSIALSLPVYATTLSLHHSTLNPVNWRITQITGGFSIQNVTNKSEYVQVVLENGSIGVFKKNLIGHQECVSSLGGESVQKSTVCELAPQETLYVDKDFADPADATGTYQIEITD